MRLHKPAILLVALLAMSAPVAAQASCDPAGGLTFICGLTNAEDLVQVPGTPWIIASGLADAEHSRGSHLSREQRRTGAVQVLLPGHVVYRQDSATFGACPGAPDETKFSAHGLSLRAGPASEHTLYVVHHGERESVEVFTLTAGPAAPSLTWVGCVALSGRRLQQWRGGLARWRLRRHHFPQHRRPEGRREADGGTAGGRRDDLAAENGVGRRARRRRRSPRTMGSPPRRMASSSSWRERGTRPWCACRSTAQQGTGPSSRPDSTRTICAGGRTASSMPSGARDSVANLFACAPNTTQRCTNPFSVLRIDPVTLQTREVVHHPASPSFGAASTALRIGNEYWFATPHGDRIAIAPAD